MTTIKDIQGRMIIDSRGNPTVEADVILEDEKPQDCPLAVAEKGKEVQSYVKRNLRIGALLIKNALKCANITANLISEPQLDKEGFKITSERGLRRVSRGGKCTFLHH